MTKTESRLVLINSLFNFANVLSTSFVSVFIYEYTKSLVMMSIYTIIRIALFPLFFTIGGKAVRKVSYSVTISGGLFFLTLMMIYILVMQDLFSENTVYVYGAAILYGVGEGLYWFSINSANQIAPLSDHRNNYLANIGIANNVTSIIAPSVSSLIFAFITNELFGYYGIFALVIFVYILIIIVSLKLDLTSKDAKPVKVLDKLWISKGADPNWYMIQVSTFAYGFQNSLTLTLTNILIFEATGGSDALYANLLIFFALASIFSYELCKRMTEKTLFQFLKVGLFFIVTSSLFLVYFDNLFGAIYFGFANAIGTAVYGNPYNYCMLNAIAKYDQSENVTGRVIAKETAMSLGRCAGMSLIVAAYYLIGEPYYMAVAVTICSLAPFFVYGTLRRYYRKEV